jgi:hypothetical protein
MQTFWLWVELAILSERLRVASKEKVPTAHGELAV